MQRDMINNDLHNFFVNKDIDNNSKVIKKLRD